jgi:AAA+ ATPase superfamily predicted ATPase
MFVNRERELAELERWFSGSRGRFGLVWGRRRVGKTSLLERFAGPKRTVFHTAAGRPVTDELRLLSRSAASLDLRTRDLEARPFADWDDALDTCSRSKSRADPAGDR